MAGIFLILLALALAGCATSGGGTSGGKGPITELHLFGAPAALNFDQVPGPDGFAVRIYAGNRDSAQGLPVKSGTLEILMFDGLLKGSGVDAPTPLRTWSYPAKELKKYLDQTSLGTGYRFALQWGDSRPAQRHISIMARYVPRQGTVVQSAPSAISLGLK